MHAEPAGPPDHGGRDAAHRIEGQDGDALVRVRLHRPGSGRTVRADGVQDRFVEGVGGGQVRQLERPQRVDRRPPQYVGIGPVPAVGRRLDDRPVLGQRAGLVQAQHIHRSEVVQSREPFDDHSTGTRQPGRAPRERRRDDDRQHFRGEPHRDGHGERQRLQTPAAQRRVGHQHQGRCQEHEADEGPGDPPDGTVEGARVPLSGPAVMGGGEPGLPAGGHDHRRTAARRDTAALEAPLRLCERSGPGQRRVGHVHGPLGHRRRLAGQGRLMHGEAVGAQQLHICGHEIARPQPDHVPRYQVGDGHFPFPGRGVVRGAAHHGRGGRHEFAQRRGRPVGAVLLGGTQQTAHGDEGQDDAGGAPGGNEGRHQTQAEEYGGEGVPEAAQETAGPGDRPPGGQHVLARPGEPDLGLCLQQPARPAAERTQGLKRGGHGAGERCDGGRCADGDVSGARGWTALRHRVHAGGRARGRGARRVRPTGRPSAGRLSPHRDRRPDRPASGPHGATGRDRPASTSSDAG
ncbi:hypothetical protein P376_4118 [Streptomyces sp. HCCB10043]|nr:hypothetical protein P376_4118 [Streptomyces sp. HCCB10043]